MKNVILVLIFALFTGCQGIFIEGIDPADIPDHEQTLSKRIEVTDLQIEENGQAFVVKKVPLFDIIDHPTNSGKVIFAGIGFRNVKIRLSENVVNKILNKDVGDPICITFKSFMKSGRVEYIGEVDMQICRTSVCETQASWIVTGAFINIHLFKRGR